MTGDYYARTSATHLDGTPMFATAEDTRNEDQVAALVERAWRCRLHRFGTLAAVDWFATRDGRPVGVLELKSRTHPSGQYPTVFLNVRKWLALHLAAAGMGVPALFVVRFTDAIRWITLADVAAGAVRIGGTRRPVKSRSDVEPVIDVPVASMTVLGGLP
ncbi:hypothetical protein [Pseudonocardia sp. D17]|uniref:hypothetical protein n=1 Tax=Pseudonocardia sp. D17 TaxID=882661 RepID=UPI002B3C7273|nr:hypothetical protein PSD17_56650 [Pseudonocardia sp. D17]